MCPVPSLQQGPAGAVDDTDSEDEQRVLPVAAADFKEQEAQVEAQVPEGGFVAADELA